MRLVGYVLLFVALVVSCKKDDPAPDANVGLVGEKGNPRFNLSFDNETNVDLDLYVTDPNGETVYYGNDFSASGGTLDVDCLCGDCPQGPTENIFWPLDDSAPKGVYSFWVEYYDYCDVAASSNYTVKVVTNSTLRATQSGSLSSGESTTWTYNHQ